MSRQNGQQHEKQAEIFLRKRGLKLLAKNFHAYRGELDLVMLDGKTLVFIEVRYRKNANYGSAADSITYKKQLSLIHGAQPDAMVLCHEPTRTHMRGLPHFPIPDLKDCIDANLRVGYLTNPNVRFVGVAVNTSKLGEREADAYLQETEQSLGLVTVDPLRQGVARIVDQII